MSIFDETLQVIYNNDGTATLVSNYYKDYDIIFDQSVVSEHLRNLKDLSNYSFGLVKDTPLDDECKSWQILRRPTHDKPGVISLHLLGFLNGTIEKDGKKMICTNAMMEVKLPS
jgi:hypothetical protein